MGKARTFLTESQIDRIVELYEGGMSMNQIAEEYRAHRRTIAARLVRRSVSLRSPPTRPAASVPEDVSRYAEGVTLLDIGRRFGASQHAARTAIAGAGGTIRPHGRVPHTSRLRRSGGTQEQLNRPTTTGAWSADPCSWTHRVSARRVLRSR